MTKKLSREETIHKLWEIASKKGSDYVYQAPEFENDFGQEFTADECYYSDSEGNPSCIVGHLLKQEFPEIFSKLNEMEWGRVASGKDDFPSCFEVRELHSGDEPVDLSHNFDPIALRILEIVQRKQDRGVSWVKAVEETVAA